MSDPSLGSGAASVSAIVVAPPFGEHLVDSVRSVLAQDYPGDRLEVIVVDGNAGPRAAQLLAPFGERVRRVVPPDDGASALDAAIAQARGELIALQYAEDEWTPDKLARQVALLARARRSVSCTATWPSSTTTATSCAPPTGRRRASRRTAAGRSGP